MNPRFLDSRWLTLADAAAFLGVSTRTLVNRVKAGYLSCSQDMPGAPRYFDRAEIEAYRERHRQVANVRPMRRRTSS